MTSPVMPSGVWRALRHFVEPYAVATFTVPGDPAAKERPRLGGGGHTFTPKATKDAEARVRAEFREALPGWEPEPDRTYGALMEFRTRAGSQVDLDNATKLVWDALNRTFWADDIQVGDSYLHLVRGGGEPGVEVVLFPVEDNGTRKTSVCECGGRFRAAGRMCWPCRKGRAAARQDPDVGGDVEVADTDRLKRKVFAYIAGCQAGGLAQPSYSNIAIVAGMSEPTARRIVQELIADGCLTRDGRKFIIVRPLGAAS